MTFTRAGLTFVLSLSVVACGGGGSPDVANEDRGVTAAASPTLSFDKAGFKSSAEAICAESNARAPDPDQQYKDIPQIQAGVKAALAAFTDVHGKLSELQYPPDAEGAELRRILVVETEKNLVEIRSASAQFDAAVATKNQKDYYEAADRFLAFEDAYPDKNGALRAYGLTECDRAFGPPE